LRYHIGKGNITVDKFKASIKKLQVNFPHAELNQVIAFFTPKDTINTEQVIKTIVARTEGFDPSFSCSHFANLQKVNNTATLSITAIQDSLNAKDFPEVVIGLREYLLAYANTDNLIVLSAYTNFHSDLYASLPDSYQEITKAFL